MRARSSSEKAEGCVGGGLGDPAEEGPGQREQRGPGARSRDSEQAGIGGT